MDLHANAALSLTKRRLLARRVVEESWTLTKAAARCDVLTRVPSAFRLLLVAQGRRESVRPAKQRYRGRRRS